MGNFCEAPHLQISCSSLTFAEYKLASVSLFVVQGNIIEEDVDAIIIISPPNLKNFDGFGRYIINKAGKKVEEECANLSETEGLLTYGTACYTSGGDLPCEYIIHAIVPHSEDKKDDLFLECIKKCLIIADKLKLKSLSFPLLCSGVPSFPKEACAIIMLKTIIEYAEAQKDKTSISEIRIVNHDNPSVRLIEEELRMLIPEKKKTQKSYRSGFLMQYDKNKLEVYNKRMSTNLEDNKEIN